MPPRHMPRHAPPWWPQNEPWPPQGPPRFAPWHAGRRAFFWRISLVLLILFGLAFAIFTFLFWSLVALLGGAGLPRGYLPPLLALAVPFLLIAFGVLLIGLRGLRRVTLPLADLVEAARRVSEGDYSARVAERGPREMRSLTRAFNSMTERLQLNDEQRRNLLADITHELRTPLTIVQGNLEGLADGIYPLDKAHLEPIVEETRVLSRLIEDLHTLALAESGALKLRKEPTDLATLIGETVSSFRPQAEAAGITLAVDVAPETPSLDVDPQRIREVLLNLLANALRYTPRGGAVSVGCRPGAGERVMVSVSDTGAGIPPDELPHIFDRFYKARDSGGSGLGLTIARNLVAAHGGEISAESSLGQGTTVRFSLPISGPESPA